MSILGGRGIARLRNIKYRGGDMIYVSSDWHGTPVDKIQRLLQQVHFSADDDLFVLGDVIDRGEHGVELIKYMMYEPNITLIRGNHEQMLLDCEFLFEEVTEESVDRFDIQKARALSLWQSNGGEPTITGLCREHHTMRTLILEYLQDTPLYDTVSVGGRDYLLVHAGIGQSANGTHKKLSECSDYDFLWTRPYLNTRYSTAFTTVLGHTPTHFYGAQYRGKILKTETWINVDTSAATGLPPALLRLDDLAEFYLEE